MGLYLGLESYGAGSPAISVEEAQIEMLEASNEAAMALRDVRELAKDIANCNEIIRTARRYGSQEVLAYASELLGVSLEADGEQQPGAQPAPAAAEQAVSDKAKDGEKFSDKVKKYWNKFCMYVKKAWRWIKTMVHEAFVKLRLTDWNGKVALTYAPAKIKAFAAAIKGVNLGSEDAMDNAITKIKRAREDLVDDTELHDESDPAKLKEYLKDVGDAFSAANTLVDKIGARGNYKQDQLTKLGSAIQSMLGKLGKEGARINSAIVRHATSKVKKND